MLVGKLESCMVPPGLKTLRNTLRAMVEVFASNSTALPEPSLGLVRRFPDVGEAHG